MTRPSAAVDLPSGRATGPARVGQATTIEQSRAVAEVQAAVILAHQRPRDETRAVERMREACARPELASRAFYRMPRADGVVTGPSIHLARELARLWGNVQYGITELDRDTHAGGRSEMLARAWDLESNTLVTAGFIVPHAKDKGSLKKGTAEVVPLVQLDAVYENNANNGARRVRECIFAVLPPWFREEAQELCRRTVEKGDGDPVHERVRKMIAAFDALGVREEQLARKVGKPSARWNAYDLADLQVIGGSIRRGEIRAEEEFPAMGATGEPNARAEEIRRQAGDRPQDDPQPVDDGRNDFPPDVTPARPPAPSRRVHALLTPWGLADPARRPDKLAFLSGVLDRPVATTRDLTMAEVDVVESFAQSVPADDRAPAKGEQITRGREILAAEQTTAGDQPAANPKD